MVSPFRLAFGYKHYMKEILHLPPVWCSSICRNAMNEICVENCAIKRDCSGFEPKPDLKLSDMPRFPLRESVGMSKEERFTSVAIYIAKIVDHLNGIEDEHRSMVIRQPALRVVVKPKEVAEVVANVNEAMASAEDK